MTSVKHYEQAAFHFGTLLHGVGSRDVWFDATPDTEWNVRDLVNHLVNEALWVPPLLAGETVEQVGDRFDGDQLGDDPASRWDEVSAAARQVLAEAPEDLAVHLSYGDTPLGDYLAQMTDDLVIHGWDLARGVGADDTVDPTLVRLVWDRSLPKADDLRASGLFGEQVAVPEGVDDQTRLLALFGRRR